MGRTKMEVEALSEKIIQIIKKEREKRIKAHTFSAKQVIDKKLGPLLKERKALDKKILSEVKKLGIVHASTKEEDFMVRELATKIANIEYPNYTDIEREVILSGDQGADVLVKKISEMYL